MNSYNFKNVLKNFKETKGKEKKEEVVKYKDVIEEKLKCNNNDSVFRKFDEVEEERKEWFKKRNDNLNKNLDDKMKEKSSHLQPDKNDSGDEIDESNIPKEFELDVNKKEWKVTVNPKQ
jgi:hypothetical protein